MGFNDYLEKLRVKPERERHRIAILATAISFGIIFIIWLVSFSEMNRDIGEESGSVPVVDQLEEMRSDMERDKNSIQDMIQNLPQTGDMESGIVDESLPNDEPQSQSQNENSNQDYQPEIPQLPSPSN